MKTFISDLSKNEFPIAEKILGKTIRPSIFGLIQKDYPEFTEEMVMSVKEANAFSEKYIEDYLIKQVGELSTLEKTVLDALKDKTTLSDNLDDEDLVKLSSGQKIADLVASFGGSWTFIIIFSIFILIWILFNVLWLINSRFDPYPFILLNLILSCLAAMQAPIIMMSQNRQEEKDRDRGKNDYMVNLKSELEIRMLHEKIDHLVINQQQEALEIHKVQIDMMNDILKRMPQA